MTDPNDDTLDIAIIGAGPCGLSAGVAATQAGLRQAIFDKGCLTRSITLYPTHATFFSTADRLEIGDVPFITPGDKPTRRDALKYYRRVAVEYGLGVRQYEEVLDVSGTEGAFRLRTRRADGSEHAYEAAAVCVATGGFHEPNWLGVPGEDLPKVIHYYREPYPFHDQDVLVVGAGNSAVESALEMWRNGARVSMVHFLETIDRGVKPWVVPDITNRLEKGQIPVYWRHRVAEVRPGSVVLREEGTGRTTEIANDWVVAMTGWRADPRLLRSMGVSIDEETGIPAHDPATMESDVSGVYIAGVLAAGHNANKIFIENGREHGGLVVEALRRRVGVAGG
ncbi:MAG: YpdA family putative bacillithiol disulfide reductase [Gemmatimonadetes bacterium]|nr:YpdA family putative bacillithiol disulfide reductase [Gemmatimonadota bacterium]